MSNTPNHHRQEGFHQSLWKATSKEGAIETSPLRGETQADCVIIGAGYTGLSAALHLATAGSCATVLEAHEPGFGASGRNGGQVNPGWKIAPSQILEAFGHKSGERLIREVSGACDLVFELIRAHAIDCEADQAGYVRGALNQKEQAHIVRDGQEWLRQGAPIEICDRQAISTLLGTTRYCGGLIDRRGGTLNPLAYARGLARAAVAQGVTIHGHSPVHSVERIENTWRVKSEKGTVKARSLVIGTNGYTDALWPKLAQTIIPVASHQTATRPLPPQIWDKMLPQGNHVSEQRRMMCYFRRGPGQRFVIGGRGMHLDNREVGPTDHLRSEAIKYFPLLKEVEWEFDWGGYVAMTRNHRPRLFQLGPDAYAGLGFQGRGVAMATLMGKWLAQAVSGDSPALAPETMETIRFHAFRNLGLAAYKLTGPWLDRL
ncbi:MAG: FAD-binding oxidoreductase [Pseudomonadota bacterium]